MTQKAGAQLLARYKIEGWPVLLFLATDGSEVNVIGGYEPPVEKYHQKVLDTLRGLDTFRSLQEQYAKGSRNVVMMTKLARKWNWKTGGRARFFELLKEIVAVDPEGKGGTTDYAGATLSSTEFAEFMLAQDASMRAERPNPATFQAFIDKYPRSPLLKEAYQGLLPYYYSVADRDTALRFYQGLEAKFPDDPDVLFYQVRWIIKEKRDLDRGVELMDRIAALTKPKAGIKGDDDWYRQTLAELQLLRGDETKAEEAFGKRAMQDKVSGLGYALVNFARFWTDEGKNLETAAAMLETALKLDPDNAYFRQSAADHYFKRGMREQAEALYGPAYLPRITEDGAALRTYAVYWADRKENLDAALTASRRSVDLTPNALAWDTLARVLSARGELKEALKAAEKAVAIDGGSNPRFAQRLKQIEAAMTKERK